MKLLGIRAIIAESYERIHRSNLIGMGILPLQFTSCSLSSLELSGSELITIENFDAVKVKGLMKCLIKYPNGKSNQVVLIARIDTKMELDYLQSDGVLNYALRKLQT